MAWYLFLLVAAGGIAFVVWSTRKKIAEREAASKARFERVMKVPVPVPAVAPAEPLQPVATQASSAPSTSHAAPVPAGAPAMERFLGKAETLLYYLLKSGLPEYEVFAKVSLASVIGAPGSGHEREQQLRRLALYQIDFVICDKSMRVIAAVELDAAVTAVGAGDQQFKADSLKRAGIRLVRVDAAAPPKREQLRALLGGHDSSGRGT